MNAERPVAPPNTDAAQGLVEGLTLQVAHWVRQAASEAVDAEETQARVRTACTATRQVVQAHLDGHVCVPLQSVWASGRAHEPASTVDQWRAWLLRSGVVNSASGDQDPTPGMPFKPLKPLKPLVLDAQDRLYLHRNFDHERQLAQHLAQRMIRQAVEPAASPRASILPLPGAVALSDEQRAIVERCLNRSLSIISGGPGTGKTTTVVQLLVAWLQHAPDLRIALAAPTGKAAARMMESLRLQTRGLQPELKDRLPTSGHTLHRLLGAGPQGFAHHAGRPLAFDVVVVDEASMLDLALARALFDALPQEARVILLGDRDQLAAVEAGSVFADLSASGPQVEVLTQNFRFGSGTGIAELAEQVRRGDESAVLAAMSRFEPRHLTWWEKAQSGYEDYVTAVRDQPGDAAGAFQAFSKFRVLCALRKGSRGVETLNERLTQALAPRMRPLTAARGGSVSPTPPWYWGRPVIVQRNDPRLGLFNGDIGITLPNSQGEMRVWFPATDAPADASPQSAPPFRGFHPAQLPSHDTAWALTVHRAQGSEFDDLLLLLPETEGRGVTRELLYTGVSRARHELMCVASHAVLQNGLRATVHRHSGLLDQIHQAHLRLGKV